MRKQEFSYDPETHLKHAVHNETFLRHLNDSVLAKRGEFADWALVVAFYAALHYTKSAILRDHGMSVARHRGFDGDQGWQQGHTELVRDHLSSISGLYKHLSDLGHDARYRGYFMQPGNATAEVKRQTEALKKIKTACGY